MNRFIRFFDDISKVIEIKLKELNLALENVELLKDKISFLEEENKELGRRATLFEELEKQNKWLRDELK